MASDHPLVPDILINIHRPVDQLRDCGRLKIHTNLNLKQSGWNWPIARQWMAKDIHRYTRLYLMQSRQNLVLIIDAIGERGFSIQQSISSSSSRSSSLHFCSQRCELTLPTSVMHCIQCIASMYHVTVHCSNQWGKVHSSCKTAAMHCNSCKILQCKQCNSNITLQCNALHCNSCANSATLQYCSATVQNSNSCKVVQCKTATAVK